MSLNENLKTKINELPGDLRDIALEILKELEKGKKSVSQIEDLILYEIRELICEEED